MKNLEGYIVNIIKHPAYSMDLNPIEEVWNEEKNDVYVVNRNEYSTKQSLKEAINISWKKKRNKL